MMNSGREVEAYEYASSMKESISQKTRKRACEG